MLGPQSAALQQTPGVEGRHAEPQTRRLGPQVMEQTLAEQVAEPPVGCAQSAVVQQLPAAVGMQLWPHWRYAGLLQLHPQTLLVQLSVALVGAAGQSASEQHPAAGMQRVVPQALG